MKDFQWWTWIVMALGSLVCAFIAETGSPDRMEFWVAFWAFVILANMERKR